MCHLYAVFILLISTLAHCDPQTHKDMLRTEFIEGIIKKVSNITLESLSNASPDKKNDIIKGIEGKLWKSASYLGENGTKYVQLIMRGVKMISSNNSAIVTHKTIQPKSNIRENNGNVIDTQTKKTKDKLINDIVHKIEKLTKVYFKNKTTPEEKYEILENIKQKLLKSVDIKHMELHNKHDEVKSYIDLITRGVELVLQRTREEHSRRMDFEFSNNINVKQDNDIERPIRNFNNEISDHESIKGDSCNNILNETCSIVKSLDKLECLYDSIQISIKKLCDGEADCSDESDEQHCEFKATEKVHIANQLISNLNSSILNNCFHSLISNTLLKRQNEILGSLLKSEINFLNKYSNVTSSKDKATTQTSVHDIADVLSTLAYALDKSLCVNLSTKEIEMEPHQIEDPIEVELLKMESEWTPKLCSCKEQLCQNTTCHSSCKRICWQTYSLDRWSCQAVSGGDTVPIDLICDGKLDCLDESDESGCVQGATYAKFEANEIYNTILKMIETKIAQNDNLLLRADLHRLNKAVKQLQQNSIKKHAEVQIIKAVRDKCFSILKSTYDGTWPRATIVEELDEMYRFLQALNEKLIAALKRTHLGNDRIITTDGCFCRENKCALSVCSKICTRSCSVEPLLTKYFCKSPFNNQSIPLEAVCNEKVNCPNGDDEENCKLNEICRKHHFVILRHHLQGVGVKEKGTAIGEVLTAWKTKVTGTLSVAEKNERPSPQILRHIINNILQDLVKTYASINDYRRSNNNILKEFSKISKILIDSLRECGK